RLTVDDKTIKPILQRLYFEYGSPYNFGVLPVEILGTVYERFLGKVIRLTAGHQAKVEEKPEVRKAGGVYYTPAYIVNYIVHNTIGKQIECKSPADLAGGKTTPPFRVLDMACGSGSFLLGAYQFLLDHCLKWYQTNPSPKHAKAIYQNAKGEPCLTIAERKRILTTNICGVDIDRQAVETTKLSLLLKALEGENDASLSQQMSLFHERALPNLSHNIKCGNSLIASDFSIDPEDLIRVHAFDWPAQFPDAMKAGGFDAIIGNPPYVLLAPEMFDEQTIEYLRCYEVAQYKADLFHLFIQKGISLTREKGLFGMIVPNTWLTLQFTDRLRHYIARTTAISEVVVFDHLVFKDANVFTALLFVEKQKPVLSHKIAIRKVTEADSAKNIAEVTVNDVLQSSWGNSEGCIFETRLTGVEGKLVQRLVKSFPKLESVARASLGCQAYNSSKHTKEQIENRVFHADHKKEEDYLPELAGNDVGRYKINRARGQWIKYGPWLHDYRTLDWLEGPRILIREICGPKPHSIFGAYVEETYCHYKTILNVNPSAKTTFSMKFLLGILNSRLISFLYPFVSNKLVAQTFPRLSVRDVKRLPIIAVDVKNPADKARHDKLVLLVDKMLALTPKLHGATSESEKAALQNAITTTDTEIDQLVYELYGLTEEEIKIVEGER
ncbi:MAG: N-6 DNA methylase, partial [Syntrophales bacterium]|nr:N-6 DNA methylase [Syntrophales bacterium]